jgi:EmrB/QacA subfamily drug resistance transporter
MRAGFTRRQWLLLLAVSLGSFVTFLDLTITNIAMPTIIEEMDTSLAQASWVLNAYTLGVAALLLSVGRIADHYGQKRIFIGGLVIFTLASLACGLAPSINTLIAFRAVQAIGAAALIPLSFSILIAGFPDKDQQATITGFFGALSAAAAALGPTLGGILTQYVSWEWIFFVNVPVGIVAFVLSLAFIPERRTASRERFDTLGTVFVSGGLFLLVLGLVQGNDWGWASASIIASLSGAAILLSSFVVWELHATSPLFDLRLFRVRPFAAASGGLFAIGVAIMGAQLILILFMTGVLGFSELKAALCVTPMPAVSMILMAFVPKLIRTVGPRFPSGLGAVAMTVGLVSLTTLSQSSTVLDVIARTAIIGAGLALMMVPLMTVGLLCLPASVGGAGSGMLNTARQVGFAVGVAVLVAILTASSGDLLPEAKTTAVAYVGGSTSLSAEDKDQLTSAIVHLPSKLGGDDSVDAAALDQKTRDVPAQVLQLSRMGSSLDTFVKQTDELAGGMRSLDEGSSTLARGSARTAEGGRRLSRGIKRLKGGAEALRAGSSKMSSGASQFAGSLAAAGPKATQLAAGGSEVSSGAGRLASGLSKASTGSSKLAFGARGVTSGASQVAGGASTLSSGLGTLADSATQLRAAAQSLESLLGAVAAAYPDVASDAQFQQAVGTAQAVSSGASQIAAGASDASSSGAKLAAGAQKVATGAAAVSAGADKLGAAVGAASSGARQVAAGSQQLAAGTSQLSAGIRSAAGGASSLSHAAHKVAAGAAVLDKGVSGAAAGAGKVSAGTREVSTGAEKIHEGTSQAARATGQMDQAVAGAALLNAADHVKNLILDAVTSSFDRSFWAAALAALLCLPLALPLGRTLPESAGGVTIESV